MQLPKVRQNLQLIPFADEDQQGFLLKDDFLNGRSLFISSAAAMILLLMNGENSVEEIRRQFTGKTGHEVWQADIESFIATLDENLFLDNENYSGLIRALSDAYKSVPNRPALMAGNGYPADPVELRKYLDECFEPAVVDRTGLPSKIRGLVVPHIDIERGRNTYGRIFKTLGSYTPLKTIVIVGVNHNYLSENPFIVTDRVYETPLGKLDFDKNFFEGIQRRLDWDLLTDELAHRGEHSVEFPALFLRYLFPKEPIQIVPVLCNFRDPEDPRVSRFIEAVRDQMADRDDIMLLASVDFSHVGPQFGWDREVSTDDVKELELQDLSTLRLFAKGNADQFYSDIMIDGNDRNIDALHPAYVFLKILGEPEGRLVQYEQAFNPVNTVTFAGLVF